MNIELDPILLLSDAQKKELSTLFYDKLKRHIANLKFDTKKIPVNDMVISELSMALEDGLISDEINYGEVGRAITSLVVSGIKGGQ